MAPPNQAKQVEPTPKSMKDLDVFLRKISNDKLTSLPGSSGTIYSDDDYRLNMQGMTSRHKFWNLQIQINKQTAKTSLKKNLGETVATVICPRQFTPAELKDLFMKSAKEVKVLGLVD